MLRLNQSFAFLRAFGPFPGSRILPGVALYHSDTSYGSRAPKSAPFVAPSAEVVKNRQENAALLRYVEAWRKHGHKRAELDPLGQAHKDAPEVDAGLYFGGSVDSKQSFCIVGILSIPDENGSDRTHATWGEIQHFLENSYGSTIGVEFEHLSNEAERSWLTENYERSSGKALQPEVRKSALNLMLRSELFDDFLGRKFKQLKRYSGEGAESMLVGVREALRNAAKLGVTDAVLCHAHRGRNNLLTCLLDFPESAFLSKTQKHSELPAGTRNTGDVLSHLFHSNTLDLHGEKILATLIPNPSHLEAVNPVAVGKARAKEMDIITAEYGNDSTKLPAGDRVMCLQIHGDAAFAGQGIVAETFNMANLPHYSIGGSVHLIVNNQIGFTTPPARGRSTRYCSDVGKGYEVPIVHVNGSDPDAVAKAMALAIEYRQQFRKDVIIDMICYRKWGHNEVDDPTMTNPVLYKAIDGYVSPASRYATKLLADGVVSEQDIEEMKASYDAHLNDEFAASATYAPSASMHLDGKWKSIAQPGTTRSHVDTGIPVEDAVMIAEKSVEFDDGVNVHDRLRRFHVSSRKSNVHRDSPGKIDWGLAETLGIGSLLLDGYNARISGQDVGRGTFAHRHAILVDQDTADASCIPLNKMTADQKGRIDISNSPLSEESVLGFEYGASTESPNTLHIWEAQFGDFFNGAQIIIDTFLSSGEDKWLRQSGLTMVLPHGYDGMGPEHSSCRIERFLQMTNNEIEKNRGDDVSMEIVYPTTPSQYFHILRRQMKRNFRKPTVVIAGKTLLRGVYSPIENIAPGTSFLPVLADPYQKVADDAVDRVVFCSGKVYYDYYDEGKANMKPKDRTVVLRIEELSPFPADVIRGAVVKYSNAKEFVWLQEEPENMGAWQFIEPRFRKQLGIDLKYVGRPALAAPAVGVGAWYADEVVKLFTKIHSK